MKIERGLFANALMTFVLTYLITQMLHEGAHAVTGLLAGAAPVLHHNHVEFETEVSHFLQTWIAAAGPLYSLMQSVAGYFIAQRKSGLSKLFWTWMTLWGYIGFFGYVFMTPFFPYGDTGFVAAQLGVSVLGRWITGMAGISAFFFIPVISYNAFASLWKEGDKRTFYNQIIFLPLIAGVAINTLLNVPVPTFLSLLAPLCMPWCIMMVYGKLMSARELAPDPEAVDLSTFSKLLAAACIVAVVVNEFLISGIHL